MTDSKNESAKKLLASNVMIQIDWVPLSIGAVWSTRGKTLAVMQVSGGWQSLNAMSQMCVLGRWMRMLTILNQSWVAKAYREFDEAGRMKPTAYYNRIVDLIEGLMKFTLWTRHRSCWIGTASAQSRAEACLDDKDLTASERFKEQRCKQPRAKIRVVATLMLLRTLHARPSKPSANVYEFCSA